MSAIVYDIIIIGAGPSGIAAAVEASILGINNVLVIEKSDNHSATIRTFYKGGKRVDKEWMGQKVEVDGNISFFDGTKESTLDYFDTLISGHKINANFNEEVESIEQVESIGGERLLVRSSKGDYHAKNVVVCIGKMGKPNKPNYEIPASIKERVNFNLDKCSKDEKILVVGGGNSAAEYAYDLADINDVALCYRKPNFTRLNAQNLLNLKRYGSNGKMRMLLGVDIEGLEADESGRVKVLFKEMAPESFDRAIYAIGGTTPTDFLKKCGIEMDKDGPVLDENFQSGVDGLFVSGDLGVSTGGSIVQALNMSYSIISLIKEGL